MVVHASSIPANTIEDIEFAVNVVADTKPKTTATAPAALRQNKRIHQDTEEVVIAKRVAQVLGGPRMLPMVSNPDTNPSQSLNNNQCFWRGFFWPLGNKKHNSKNTSPSAVYTEYAPPLPPPPSHLTEHPNIINALRIYKNHIKVQTPYNVEHLRLWTFNHPNQPFVQSVLCSLQEGFWSLDNGEWDFDEEDAY